MHTHTKRPLKSIRSANPSQHVHVWVRKLYIQFPYRWAESYFQLLFLFEANECRLKRCWFHLNKRPQHLRINWQVCPLQDWNRKHNLNIHTPQWAEWISKLLIRPTYFSSSLSCGGLRAWTRASSLLNVKWCNLLSGGVDKLVFSVTVMFPISHDLRRSFSYVCVFAQTSEWRSNFKDQCTQKAFYQLFLLSISSVWISSSVPIDTQSKTCRAL